MAEPVTEGEIDEVIAEAARRLEELLSKAGRRDG
jgi:hypothetical protein